MSPLIDDLVAARMQMALSLGWHIVVACLGVGFPLLVLLAEWRWIRSGDDVWRVLAHRWAKGLAVVFAVGAVSGTILSSEMGVLWPGLIGTFGEVIGLPFAIEGIAFFIEAIFLGIYLFAWDRLPPKAHLLSGVPIVLAGVASAFLRRHRQCVDAATEGLWRPLRSRSAPAGWTTCLAQRRVGRGRGRIGAAGHVHEPVVTKRVLSPPPSRPTPAPVVAGRP